VLESMALMNPSARRCLRVITDLCGNYLQSGPGRDIRDGIGVNGDGWRPTEESPQTQLASLYPLMWPTLETGMGMGVEGDSIMYGFLFLHSRAAYPLLSWPFADHASIDKNQQSWIS
jgi:hypothetical protein